VDDHSGPTVGHGGLGDHVAHQCRAQGSAPVHDQHGTLAGGVEDLLDQAVVLVALDGADRTGEEGSPTVSAELRGAATQGVAVLAGGGTHPRDTPKLLAGSSRFAGPLLDSCATPSHASVLPRPRTV